jgi:hypothetical protein
MSSDSITPPENRPPENRPLDHEAPTPEPQPFGSIHRQPPNAGTPLGASAILPRERIIAADVMFPVLGSELVARLTEILPTDRMSQDGLHVVLYDSTLLYQDLLFSMQNGNPGNGGSNYTQGNIQETLRHEGIPDIEAETLYQRLQAEIFNYTHEKRHESASHYQKVIAPEEPYERLRQRDTHIALSTNPHADVKPLIEKLQLSTSTAMRFERAYVAYVQEQNKLHVASANLTPYLYHAPANTTERPSNRIAAAVERSDELLDIMAQMLLLSDSPALPADDFNREYAARRLLVKELHASQKVLPNYVTSGINLNEPSDYRFVTSVRDNISYSHHQPDMKPVFDQHVMRLQAIADNVLDPNKIGTFAKPLLFKEGKELAATLDKVGVKDSKAVADRIVNIFAKQIDLVQSRGSGYNKS